MRFARTVQRSSLSIPSGGMIPEKEIFVPFPAAETALLLRIASETKFPVLILLTIPPMLLEIELRYSRASSIFPLSRYALTTIMWFL